MPTSSGRLGSESADRSVCFSVSVFPVPVTVLFKYINLFLLFFKEEKICTLIFLLCNNFFYSFKTSLNSFYYKTLNSVSIYWVYTAKL